LNKKMQCADNKKNVYIKIYRVLFLWIKQEVCMLDNHNSDNREKDEKEEELDSKRYKDEKIEKEEVLFENSFGGFKENEYIINVEAGNVPPRSWSNIIANQKMGTITTENSGGYTWINNSRLNRITTWENDAIKDFQTESIIIKDTDKKEARIRQNSI